ncbi:MAG: tetratricopeptide repeat protein [Prochloraceae cyanobacterium]
MPRANKRKNILRIFFLGLITISLLLFSQFLVSRVIAATADRQERADLLFEQGIEEYQSDRIIASIRSWEEALTIYQDRIIGENLINSKSTNIPRLLDKKGKILSNLGSAYYSLEKYDRAIDYYQQRNSVSRQLNDLYGEAKTLNAMGRIYYILGKYPQAIGLYQKSLTIAKQIKIPQGEGITLNNLGDVYIALEDYERGIDYYQQSLAIARRIEDLSIESQSLENIGMVHKNRQEYKQAIEFFENSLKLAREIENRQKERGILNNLGITFYRMGQFNKALEYHQQSRTRASALGNLKEESQSLNYIGSCYYAFGDYNTAISYYQQSLNIAKKVSDRGQQAKILNNLGSTYATLGDHNKAISYYDRSLEITQKINNKKQQARSLGKLGIAYAALGDYNKAIYYYEKQLFLVRTIGTKAQQQQVSIDLGNAYLSLDDYVGVIDTYEQIINFSNLPDNRQQAIVLGTLGNAYLALGNYKRSIEYLRPYLAITQKIEDIHGQKIALNHLGFALYNTGNLVEAERLLRQRIALDRNQKNSDKFSAFEQQYFPYSILQKTLVAENKPEEALEIAAIEKEIYLNDLLGIKNNNSEGKNLSLQEIRKIAKSAKATLIIYSLPSKTQLYIWAIKPTGETIFSWKELPDFAENEERSYLTNLVDRSLKAIAAHSEVTKEMRKERDLLLQELYRLLIVPIADFLPKNLEDKVIFIPDKEFFLTPFSALKDGKGEYLIRKNIIAQIPTIELLRSSQQNSQKETLLSQSLVVGDSKIAARVADILDTTTVDRTQASETLIKKVMPQAQVIYLTTEELLDRNLNGGISFTTSKDDDGRLTPQEILKLNLNARTVAIDVINLKLGQIEDRDILALSAAFITAGVDRVIVPLWSTSEEFRLNLMNQFYTNWQENGNVALSLRQAISEEIERDPSSFDWAAFTLIGG